MRTRTIEKLEQDVRLLTDVVDRMERKVDRIELVTVVREPNTQVAADAYNGLRKQVIAAVSARNAHLHQLAQFSVALAADATPEDLSALVEEWLGQASMVAVDDLTLAEAFELVGPERATGRRVLQPAYVDELTGRVVRQGVVERFDQPATGAEPDPGASPGPLQDEDPIITTTGGAQ